MEVIGEAADEYFQSDLSVRCEMNGNLWVSTSGLRSLSRLDCTRVVLWKNFRELFRVSLALSRRKNARRRGNES